MKTASRSEMEVLAKKLVAPVVEELREEQRQAQASLREMHLALRDIKAQMRDQATVTDLERARDDARRIGADATRLIQGAVQTNLKMHEELDDKLMQQRLAVAGIDDKVNDQRKELQQTEQATLRRVKLLEDLTPTIRATQLAHDKVHERMLARFEQLENLSIKNHSAAINKVAEALVEVVGQVAARGE